jgi:deoxyribodipyrimidine photo-lyase
VRRSLFLFTCDLRVRDNPALAAALAEQDEVVPAFVLDERLLAGSCGAPNRIAFMRDCLRDLDGSLRARGAGLVVRRATWSSRRSRWFAGLAPRRST